MPARTSAEDPMVHRTFAIIDASLQLGLIALGLLMATLDREDPIYRAGFGLMIVLIVVLGPLAVVSSVYLARIYLHDARTRRSWLLLRDALIAGRLTIVAAFLAVLALLRLQGYTDLPWAGPLLVVALVIVAEIPLYMAAIYWLRRRANGDYTPPPMND